MQPYRKSQKTTKITPLRVVEHPNALGAHLRYVRERQRNVSPQDIAVALPEYFEEYNVTFPTANPLDTYRKIEKGVRAVQYEELVPLYAALTGCGIRQSAEERHKFVRLARQKLESLQRRRPKLRPDSQWDTLEAELAKIDQQGPKKQATSAFDAALSENVFDISHVVGRDDWLKTALSYLHTTPPKKLVIVQAMMGMGKTTCLKLLLHTLLEQEGYQPLLHLFSDREDMTSEDHLDNFLATVLATREVILPETRMPTRQEQIKLLLSDLHKAEERVVLLLDDAQVILDEHGQLPPIWQDFFTEFLQRPHKATIYLATRQWSIWPGRDPIYIVDGDAALLPPLSPQAGAEIWQRFGFGDVDEQLRQRATERFGGNPRMIELQATAPQRRKLPFAWEWGETAPLTARKNEHQELIEQILQDSHIFGPADVEVQHLLGHVVSQHISSDALPILEVLAVSPLALPFPLLVSVTSQARYALVELLDASLLDQTARANQRAGVQPLTREAVLHTFLKEESQRLLVEQQISQLYELWMNEGTFRDEQEQAILITEAVILYLKHRQLLEAAGLFIRFGWLCAMFGLVARIQRTYEEVIKQDRREDGGDAYEAGRILLLYHFSRVLRKKVDSRARDADYRHIYNLVLEGRVVLDPRVEIYLAHTLMDRIIYEKRYQEAYDLLQNTFDGIEASKPVTPNLLFAFLHDKAYMLGRWSRRTSDPNEAIRLTQESVEAFSKAAETLRECLKKASPAQERYYEFKLARVLNDLAYYARRLHRYDEAEQAIRECLFWKGEKKVDSLGSLAVSLGEYAQLLVTKGEYRNADEKNHQAIQLLDQVLQDDSSVTNDKGMLLVERAHIYEVQGRLEEEKQLLRESLDLLPDGHDFRIEAQQRLVRIQVIEESSVRCQLDSHWYRRYLLLARFDDLALLAQAGPFTDDEKRLWDQLYPERNDPAVWKQLEKIIGDSREREFERTIVLGRLPHIHHPALDIEDVLARIQGFQKLKDEIAQEETNVVIRRLYLNKIEEQLLTLRSIEATHRQDIDTLRVCNETLFGKISKAEMEVALRELFKMLMKAQRHPQAREVAVPLLRQLKEWGLSVEDFLSPEQTSEKRVLSQKERQWRKTPVSLQAVQRLFEEVLATYGFTEWCVVHSPDRDIVSLNLEKCEMYLPTSKRFSVLTTAELLTEEIETHMFRAVSGKRSRVALLGSGTRGYLSTEEGLARWNVQEMLETQGLGKKDYAWLTTLAPGMASGILVPPQSFRTLYEFLKKAFLATQLESGKYETTHDAELAALLRVSRTFGGIPDQEVRGVCNLFDGLYMHGYHEVIDALQKYSYERLLVGSISIADLKDMEELHILQPTITHQRLAHDPQLFERIVALEK